MSRLVLRAYGRTVAAEGDRDTVEAVRSRLPLTYRVAEGEPERVFAAADPEPLLSELELWVAEHARPYVFVHAGCVAVDGRAIVIPGRSLAGKSSLVLSLLRAGATYYSDEYAVLDRNGLVRPYARPLSVRPYDGGAPHRRTPEELGAVVGRRPVPVGCVADLRYDPADGWAAAEMSAGQAVLRLLDNTVPARGRPRAALTALARVAEQARSLTGTRGDADETATRLLELLAR